MEPIVIGSTPAGLPSAAAGNIRIHSRYDPSREAERFLDTQDISGDFRGVVILIGAGLGYLDKALTRRVPECRIIAVHLASELFHARIDSAGRPDAVVRWHPGSEDDVDAFLHANLKEFEVPGLRILEWQASAKARPMQANRAKESVASLVRFHSGNISATAAFGRHWIRNLLRNFVGLDNLVSAVPEQAPVVMAASGPSLEEALPVLSRYRKSYRLWSLPSSLPALASAELEPDLILSTDAGFWARLHTRYFPRHIPVAMPLSAIPAPGNPVMPLLQDIPGEKTLLAGTHWSGLPLPEAGTVAATAVHVWRRLGRGPLVLVGLDMAWTDLRSHARPHGFDGWLDSGRSRIGPAQTMAWERALAQAPNRDGIRRWGPSLRTYADWFDTVGADGKVVRYRAENPTAAISPLKNLRQVGSGWFADLPGIPSSGSPLPVAPAGDRGRRRDSVRRLLGRWMELIGSGDTGEDAARLGYMLDPAGVLDAGRLSGAERQARMSRHFEEVAEILRGLSRVYG